MLFPSCTNELNMQLLNLQLHGGLTMLISSREEERLVEKGLKAFGEAAVYFGGPYELNNPGLRASHVHCCMHRHGDM